MGGDAEWIWALAPRAADQFDELEPPVRDRIVTKLDDVVRSQWRDPADFLEPITGGPFSKLRVGEFRLACVLEHETQQVLVHRIEHRSGAYTADD